MGRVVHHEIYDRSPNESDNEGSSYIACGFDGDMDSSDFTTSRSGATCKRCLTTTKAAGEDGG